MNANTKLKDAIRAFVKVPMVYDAAGESKESRRENLRNLQHEWADNFWSAFENGVGVRFWESPDLSGCGAEGDALKADINEFVVSLGHKIDLYRNLSFWAGKAGGYRAIWAQRFAKILFDLGVRDDAALLQYAYAYLNSIKAIREIIEGNRESAKGNQWKAIAAQVAHEFSKVVSAIGDADVRRKWGTYVRHYLVVLSGGEEDLAKVFTEARKERANGAVSEESTIAYAWILHDCIRQAIDKLKNGKLVELFLSEIKTLPLKDLPAGKPSDIGNQLYRDIKRGKSFLDGTLEAQNLFKQGNIAQAIAALAQKVREQPNNLALRMELIDRCTSNGDFVTAFDSVNYFFTLGNVRFGAESENKADRDGKTEHSISQERLIATLTRYVDRFPRDNSVFFYSQSNGRKIPNWKLFNEGLAGAYVDFVQKFIKGHLDDNDRQGVVNSQGVQYKSLSERICECLFRCVVNGVDAEKRPLIEKNGWVYDFVLSEYSLSKGWRCNGEMMVPRLALMSGQVEAARKGFEKYIANRPQDAEGWYWLGMTCANDNSDFAKCMCKSILLSKKGFLAGEAHERLAEYFSAVGRKPEQLRELQKAVNLKKKAGIRTRASGRILGLEWFDGVQSAPDDNAEIMKLASEAESLISSVQEECPAVVVAVVKKNSSVRVYIVADGRGFFAYAPADGLVAPYGGMPVTAILTSANRNEPLKVFSRESGSDWDVFSASTGIVIAVDDNYGFAKIAIDDGVIADICERHFPVVGNIKIGDLVFVRYEVRSGKVCVYSCEAALRETEVPPFVKETSGCLRRDNKYCEFGYVGDVFVPGGLCREIPEGSEVVVCAVRVATRHKQKAAWQAVKLKYNEFNKGGGDVLRG